MLVELVLVFWLKKSVDIEEEWPSLAFHFCNTCWRLTLKAKLKLSSFWDGVHCSTRDDSTLTAWLISGRWLGSLFAQCPASSATFQMLWNISSSMADRRMGSTAFFNTFLSWRKGRNHATRLLLSSGREPSKDFLPVMISIKTTPKAYTSTFLVTLPVAVHWIEQLHVRYIPACLSYTLIQV